MGVRSAIILLLLAVRGLSGEDPRAAFFEKEVRPLLASKCYECHGVGEGQKIKGGLRLDIRQGWEHGGDSGPALVKGDVEASLLVRAVRYADPELQMPPKEKLSDHEVVVLERWIVNGAFDPREASVEDLREASSAGIDYEAGRAFWSLQSPEDPDVPPSADGWARTPMDAFLLDHWQGRGVGPARAVDMEVLVRRLSDALVGLPPSLLGLEGVDWDRPDARERLVDRLLASPRYGERWGRHWLDVARYADSNGMDENMTYAEAYRYRDYVIAAFNADKPYDAFVVEQLAGDLLEDSHMHEKVATGFLAIGPKMLACDDPQKMRMDIVDEQIDTTGRAFLGMTFGCARCHDHKFDPISAKDYYGLAGMFMSTKTMVNYRVVAKWHEYDFSPPDVQEAHAEMERLRKQSTDKKASDEARAKAKDALAKLEATTPPLMKVMGITENPTENARVHLRGSYQTLGEETVRQVPMVFHRDTATQQAAPEDQSGRLQLAQWIASESNPLTARVWVNRLWRWHFGQGIVPSTDNFGMLGSAPRHRSLLDHLAHELTRGDWSVKRLQRLITTSSRYHLASDASGEDPNADLATVIPNHHVRRRLDAESLRDALLGLGDRLDLRMGGQLLLDQPGTYVNRNRLNQYLDIPRRAVYMPIVRSALYDAFVAFDMADPSAPEGNRRESVVAPQALYLMNSQRVHDAALALAASLPDTVAEKKLAALYQKALFRKPHATERERALAFIASHPEAGEAWTALCRVLLASNAFLYLD